VGGCGRFWAYISRPERESIGLGHQSGGVILGNPKHHSVICQHHPLSYKYQKKFLGAGHYWCKTTKPT